MSHKKEECEECKKKIRTKNLIYFKGKHLCKVCKYKKGNSMNIYAKDSNKIPKHIEKNIRARIKREAIQEERRRKKQILKNRKKLPGIKSIKPIKRTHQLSIHLTLEEKQISLKLLMNRGMSFEKAKERVKELSDYTSQLIKKIREKYKSEEMINKKFKEEFAKMIEEYK